MDADKAVSEWSLCDDYQCDVVSKELIGNLIECLDHCQDNDDKERFLHLLFTPNAVIKLVDVLQVTRDIQILMNALTLLRAFTDDKKSARCANISRSRLLPVLMEMALNASSAPKECSYLILEILTQFFKSKANSLTACQEANLVANLIRLLETEQQGKAGRKLDNKRKKLVAVALGAISRHKEGRQLMDGDVMKRLYRYLLLLPDNKSLDFVANKIGLAILRCVPLQNLPLSKLHSAFSYPPFGSVPDFNQTDEAASSDSSDGSDTEEEEEEEMEEIPGKQHPRVRRNRKAHHVNPQRSAEELDQYARFFASATAKNDELRDAFQSIPDEWGRTQIYEHLARKTRALNKFRMIPYPDWINAQGSSYEEDLYVKNRDVCRDKLLKTLKAAFSPELQQQPQQVVYDLDSLLLMDVDGGPTEPIRMKDLPLPEARVIPEVLHFESRFESGNLRRVLKVGRYEYDLLLNADVNASGRQQWFYFRVANIRSSVAYTFNIINLEKQRSLFNQGMQPVVFSVRRCLATGEAHWQRSGSDICYYRNVFRKQSDQSASYWTLSFDLTFAYDDDVCYVAYHYPYTYSQLMTDILIWRRQRSATALRTAALCRSPCGNIVPVLLVGCHGNASKFKISFFSSRVHPVESNSSYVMRGLISAALQQQEEVDQKKQPPSLIILVPMLNVDGVIHGCSRCELSNEDLNRRWLKPDAQRHPSIYHAKGLLEYVCSRLGNRPSLLCDIHGHSRRFNVFFYGCCRRQSWSSQDRSYPQDDTVAARRLVEILAPDLGMLDVDQCSWQVEKNRETTARIVAWRHLAISSASTLECSLAGSSDTASQQGIHFNTTSYSNVGRALHRAALRM
jgi:hypothetical protein